MKMHKGYFAAGTVLLVLAIGCITVSVVEIIVGVRAMREVVFWGSVSFHAAAAIAAMVLLDSAWRRGAGPSSEDRS